MKFLFLHQNMPGQFKHLARILAQDPANQVVFLTNPKPGVEIPNVHKVEYRIPRQSTRHGHYYLIGVEKGVLRGQEVWRVCRELRDAGFYPDVMVTHPGWGDALYLKDIYPKAALLNFFEFYYNSNGNDRNFVYEEAHSLDDMTRIRTKNIINHLSLESADWGLSPTFWQKIQHPQVYWPSISVIHDGIDTDAIRPATRREPLTLPNGRVIGPDVPLVTYVSRNFEPYRGFNVVMRGLKHVLDARPDCQIIVIGADGVSYGRQPKGQLTYRQMMLQELKPDLSRLHFTGPLPYGPFIEALRRSDVHIYFTVPFVLSWSMMESMAAGCALIASNTAPVREVVRDGYNGLLTDFYDDAALADKISLVLDDPKAFATMRQNARQTIEQHYSLNKLMPLYLNLIQEMGHTHGAPEVAARALEAFNKEHYAGVQEALIASTQKQIGE
jgi:glycosyltransferase involved in cell wall biosynthesis